MASEQARESIKGKKSRQAERAAKKIFKKLQPFINDFNKLGIGKIFLEDNIAYVTKFDPKQHEIIDAENHGAAFINKLVFIEKLAIMANNGYQMKRLGKAITGR